MAFALCGVGASTGVDTHGGAGGCRFVACSCLCSAAPDACFGPVFVSVGAPLAPIDKLPVLIIKVDVGTA